MLGVAGGGALLLLLLLLEPPFAALLSIALAAAGGGPPLSRLHCCGRQQGEKGAQGEQRHKGRHPPAFFSPASACYLRQACPPDTTTPGQGLTSAANPTLQPHHAHLRLHDDYVLVVDAGVVGNGVKHLGRQHTRHQVL